MQHQTLGRFRSNLRKLISILQKNSWATSVISNNFEILVISNFTLYGTYLLFFLIQGTLKKGNKPDFHNSMSATQANVLYEVFITNAN